MLLIFGTLSFICIILFANNRLLSSHMRESISNVKWNIILLRCCLFFRACAIHNRAALLSHTHTHAVFLQSINLNVFLCADTTSTLARLDSVYGTNGNGLLKFIGLNWTKNVNIYNGWIMQFFTHQKWCG